MKTDLLNCGGGFENGDVEVGIDEVGIDVHTVRTVSGVKCDEILQKNNARVSSIIKIKRCQQNEHSTHPFRQRALWNVHDIREAAIFESRQ